MIELAFEDVLLGDPPIPGQESGNGDGSRVSPEQNAETILALNAASRIEARALEILRESRRVVAIEDEVRRIQARDEAKEKGKDNHRGFHFVQAAELELTRPVYIDPDRRFEHDTLASIFGDPESGKTLLAILTACEIATLGLMVFYIVGEGQRGFRRRLEAWCIEHSVTLAGIPLYVSMVAATINDEENVAQVIESARELVEAHGAPALLVIDTLARNLEGNENAAEDMGAFLRGVDRIRAALHCTVLVLHHPGHMAKDRSRGHTSWKGALDTEYRLDKDESGIIRLMCTKSKDSAPPEPCAFALKQVPLPIVDDDGRDVFSVVLVPTDYEPKTPPGKVGRGRWQTAGLEALQGLQERYRANLEGDGRDPDSARVPLNDWREACLAAGMPKRTFYKVQEALKAESLLSFEHGFVSALRSAVPCVSHTQGTKRHSSEEGKGHKGHSKGTANGTQTAQPLDDFDDDLGAN